MTSSEGERPPAERREAAGHTLREAPISRVLTVINVAIFVAQVIWSGSSASVMHMPKSAMIVFGANYAAFTVGDGRPELLLSSCFLHFGLLHLGFNMFALSQVGPFVERAVGPARYLPLYVASGIAGSAASAVTGWLTSPERLSAGASGAICGIIGAALVIGVRTQGWRGPLVRAMGFWLGMNLLLGLSLGADNAAHAGGAIAGAVIAALWRRGYVYTLSLQRWVTSLTAFVILATALAVAIRPKKNPLLYLDLAERIERAEELLHRGRCEEALDVARAADRLRPGKSDLVSASIAEECRL